MKRFAELKKFIPLLRDTELGEWVAEPLPTGRVEYSGRVQVEYADVVFRFIDALEALVEAEPGCMEGSGERSQLIGKLMKAIRSEEGCPGLLLALLESGAVADWLEALVETDKRFKK